MNVTGAYRIGFQTADVRVSVTSVYESRNIKNWIYFSINIVKNTVIYNWKWYTLSYKSVLYLWHNLYICVFFTTQTEICTQLSFVNLISEDYDKQSTSTVHVTPHVNTKINRFQSLITFKPFSAASNLFRTSTIINANRLLCP